MENLFNPWNLAALRAGMLPSPIPLTARLQQVAFDDVMALAALVIESPERFAGGRITVASDELNAVEASAALAVAGGIRLEPRQIEIEKLPPGLHALFAWLATRPHRADIKGLR